MGVTRTNGIPGLPPNNNCKVSPRVLSRLGTRKSTPDEWQSTARPRDGRGSCCQQIGFCFQGCKSGAKWSTLYTEIPEG